MNLVLALLLLAIVYVFAGIIWALNWFYIFCLKPINFFVYPIYFGLALLYETDYWSFWNGNLIANYVSADLLTYGGQFGNLKTNKRKGFFDIFAAMIVNVPMSILALPFTIIASPFVVPYYIYE